MRLHFFRFTSYHMLYPVAPRTYTLDTNPTVFSMTITH